MQDSSGVIFRAVDTKTGESVAVRRFFPFGSSGSGLMGEERLAYDVAVERLAGVKHPALRAVVAGGCDPVDGIPFIAAEWIDGVPLAPLVEQGPLLPKEAIELITLAMEVSEVLSHVLAEEAVWVETDPRMIVVGSEESGRGFTFWISPLKWLGSDEERRGLESILKLTETLMGWDGKTVSDQAANGLGSWYKWLAGTAKTTTLHEALEMLAASTGGNPPLPVKVLVKKAEIAAEKSGAAGPWFKILLSVLVLAALGWFFHQRRNQVPPAAVDLARQPPAVKAAGEKIIQSFAPYDHELLLNEEGQTVVIVGMLAEIDASSPQRMFLHFSKSPELMQARGVIEAGDMAPDFDREALSVLIGKQIRVRGVLSTEVAEGVRRPVVRVKDRQSIEIAR